MIGRMDSHKHLKIEMARKKIVAENCTIEQKMQSTRIPAALMKGTKRQIEPPGTNTAFKVKAICEQ